MLCCLIPVGGRFSFLGSWQRLVTAVVSSCHFDKLVNTPRVSLSLPLSLSSPVIEAQRTQKLSCLHRESEMIKINISQSDRPFFVRKAFFLLFIRRNSVRYFCTVILCPNLFILTVYRGSLLFTARLFPGCRENFNTQGQ